MSRILTSIFILFFLFTNQLIAQENIMILKLKDGDVKIELFEDVAPNHVKRIKELADILDLDFLEYDEKGLVDMFQYMEEHKDIDGIFGMSIDRNNIPYDTYVVTPTYKLVPIITKLNRYVCVDSAFSGFGIYRYSSIWDTGAKYDYKNINEIEHIHFNKNFNKLIVDTQFNPRYISLAEDKMRFRIAIVILMLILFYLIKNNIRK